MTHNVRDRAVEGLAVHALLLEDVAVLVEEAVGVVEARLLEAEVVIALRNTVHVGGIDSEVKTNRVPLDRGGIFLSRLLLVLLGGGSGLLIGGGFVGVVNGDGLVSDGLVNLSDMVPHTEILRIVVKVVVVVDDDGLMAINVLDDAEWVELDLVGYLVLAAHKDTVVKDLDKVLEVLLDLDLVPVDANARVADREALLFIGGLDLDLHDAVLEEGHVEVEVASTELHSVLLLEVLVLVEVELGVDGVLVDDEAVRLDVVRRHQVVALHGILVVFLAIVPPVASELVVVVASEHSAEAVAVVLLAARLRVLCVELVVAVVAVRDVRAVLGVVVVAEGIVGGVGGSIVEDGLVGNLNRAVVIKLKLLIRMVHGSLSEVVALSVVVVGLVVVIAAVLVAVMGLTVVVLAPKSVVMWCDVMLGAVVASVVVDGLNKVVLVMDRRVVEGRGVVDRLMIDGRVVHRLVENVLQSFLMGGEGITGSVGLEADHASCENGACEVHSECEMKL